MPLPLEDQRAADPRHIKITLAVAAQAKARNLHPAALADVAAATIDRLPSGTDASNENIGYVLDEVLKDSPYYCADITDQPTSKYRLHGRSISKDELKKLSPTVRLGVINESDSRSQWKR